MKKFDKFICFLFSLIMLALIIFCFLLMYGVVDVKVLRGIGSLSKNAKEITSIVLIILALFAIKGIFFQSREEKVQKGILLENNNGKLLISATTLENLASDVAKDLPGIDNTYTKIKVNKNNNLVVTVRAVVSKDAIIKDVTKILQEKIKDAIKQASDLEIEEVNVDITKISNRKMKDDEKQALEKQMTNQEYNEYLEEEKKKEKAKEKEEKTED